MNEEKIKYVWNSLLKNADEEIKQEMMIKENIHLLREGICDRESWRTKDGDLDVKKVKEGILKAAIALNNDLTDKNPFLEKLEALEYYQNILKEGDINNYEEMERYIVNLEGKADIQAARGEILSEAKNDIEEEYILAILELEKHIKSEKKQEAVEQFNEEYGLDTGAAKESKKIPMSGTIEEVAQILNINIKG